MCLKPVHHLRALLHVTWSSGPEKPWKAQWSRDHRTRSVFSGPGPAGQKAEVTDTLLPGEGGQGGGGRAPLVLYITQYKWAHLEEYRAEPRQTATRPSTPPLLPE